MYRSSSSRIFPVIILVVVVVALIAGLTTLGRYIFSSGSSSGDSEVSNVASDNLRKVSVGRSVRMTIRGPIVANEDFRSYRLEVSPVAREYRVYTGYLDRVERDFTQELDNNNQAYEQFVHALDKAAMTRPGRQAQDSERDLRGICASGNVYEFEIVDGSTTEHHFWTSDCKGSPGTFGADLSQVMTLFSRQLPEGLEGFRQPQNRLQF